MAPSSENEIQIYSPSSGAPAMSDDAAAPSTEAPRTVSGGKSVPESYSVQSGDTLWDICQKLLDNPWYWPKLWSLNEYITNPHEIYPGNRLVFFPGSETAPPRMEVVTEGGSIATTQTEAGPLPVTQGVVASVPAMAPAAGSGRVTEVKLKSLTLVSEKELNEAGWVTHSGEQKSELFFGDHVYLKFKRKQQVSVGDRFHIVVEVKKVKTPDAFFGTLGVLVRKVAVINVVAIHKNTVEAVVADCDDSFRRGAKFIPFVSPIRKVVPHPLDKSIEGMIVEDENQQFLISNNDFVYLNLGRKQGVDAGAQLFVVRRGDALVPGADKKLPDVVYGRLLVVETGDNTSTAYVTDLKDSLQVGDRVRSKIE
jgi:hypothetical protein